MLLMLFFMIILQYSVVAVKSAVNTIGNEYVYLVDKLNSRHHHAIQVSNAFILHAKLTLTPLGQK